MNQALNNVFFTGRRNNIVSGVPVQMYPSGNNYVRSGIRLYASTFNSGLVYIGSNSGITANTGNFTDGFPLPTGAAFDLRVDDPSKVWLVGDSNNGTNTVFWIAN